MDGGFRAVSRSLVHVSSNFLQHEVLLEPPLWRCCGTKGNFSIEMSDEHRSFYDFTFGCFGFTAAAAGALANRESKFDFN